MKELRLAEWLVSSALGSSNKSGQAAVVASFSLNIFTTASLKEMLSPAKILSLIVSLNQYQKYLLHSLLRGDLEMVLDFEFKFIREAIVASPLGR